MGDYVLVLNAGSSSLKFCVYEPRDDGELDMLIGGQIEGIGTSPSLKAKDKAGASLVDQKLDSNIKDGYAAIDFLAKWLRSQFPHANLLGVGHRVVHGGKKYFRPTVIDEAALNDLKELIPLAPLHQPYNLAAIEALLKARPELLQLACFDTGFHRTHEEVVDLVALPYDIRNKGVQRYGFHGISYEYISSMLPKVAPGIANGKVIVAHLGSGASLCAMKNGKSIDSTLGFTALDGLCMGTRPGALDPGVVLYLFQSLMLSAKEVETLLYKKSGLLGISGISNDMRVLLESKEPAAKLAIDYFVFRITKEIGALSAVLGGLDALVFTAGIGENSPMIRQRICEASSWLGIEIDASLNDKKELCISKKNSKVCVWVIPTNEELMIARSMRLTITPTAAEGPVGGRGKPIE
jgi:acetate kinase